MPSTIQLSRTILVTQNYVRNAPLTLASNEPAFSNADWVRQFLLAPPFAWPWNRKTVSVDCVVGQQDYSVALSDYGWLEKGVVVDPDTTAYEIEVKTVLGDETLPNQPTHVSPQIDDGAGNITFRLLPPPDKEYTLRLVYQKSAPNFTETTDTWAPVPDVLSYLFNQGFLAKAYEYLDDPRFGGSMQLFLRQALAANEGLSDADKNLFLGERLVSERESQNVSGNAQLARQSRGMF